MNKKSTFKILFYLKRNAQKKNGEMPIMCRITVNGTISQFSCKLDVDPSLWDTKGGRASGKSDVAKELNKRLDKIRVNVNKHYLEIFDRDNFVTAEKVKNAHLGLGMYYETLLKVFEEHNKDFGKQRDAKIRSQSTYSKYCAVYEHLKAFIKQRYNVNDIALKELTPAFISYFELYLRVEKGCCTNTIIIYMMPLRRMITSAINNGWLQRDPFVNYELQNEETHRGFLDREELIQLMESKMERKSQELIRDLYVFCCFTGLSFIDLKTLKPEHLITRPDGLWIIKNRHKTTTEFQVRLLDIPLQILEHYRGLDENGYIFAMPHYGTIRYNLPKIQKQCGLNKHITWHMSRHTMATEVCLTNGMSIETVSKILGHKHITTTQIYAKITQERNSNEMDSLSKQLQKVEAFRTYNTASTNE